MKGYISKFEQMTAIASMTLAAIGSSGSMTPANALTFNFTPTAGTSQQAIDGFRTAGERWSAIFDDNITVNINIDFAALGGNTLAQAGSSYRDFSYTQVYNALNSDRTSATDNAAVYSLSSNGAFKMLTNYTTDNPNGSGSAVAYLDADRSANNSNVSVNTANAKALGLIGNSGTDASISFSTQYLWDFDGSNGIDTSSFDFVGIAAHEIGHAMGFVSGVDTLDYNRVDYSGDAFRHTTLDLFRYSTQSSSLGANDFTADNRDKYFSLDGGTTAIASFSNGANTSDGYQASHWKDNLGLGVMDPTAGRGELLQIVENDKVAFDAIGWNRVDSKKVPEPADCLGTFVFAAFGIKMVVNRRKRLAKSIDRASNIATAKTIRTAIEIAARNAKSAFAD
jgi:hypothetical protein